MGLPCGSLRGGVMVGRPGNGAPGSPRRGREGRCCPTLAGRAAVSSRSEWVAAAQGLAGPAATCHEASEASTQIAGLSGIWKLLAAQVGLPQILTAFKRGWRGGGQRAERVRGEQWSSSLLGPELG